MVTKENKPVPYSNDDVSGYTLKVGNLKVNIVTEYKTDDTIVTPYIYADIADGFDKKEIQDKISEFMPLTKAAEEAIGKALETFAESEIVSENTRQWCKDTLKIANEIIEQFKETKFQKPITIDMPNGKSIEITAYPYNYGQPANSINEIEGYDTDSDVITGGGSDIYKYASEIVSAEALQKHNEQDKAYLQKFFETNVLPIRDIPYNERTQEQQDIMSMYSDWHKDCYFHRPHSDEQDVCYQHYLQKENADIERDIKKYEITGYLGNNYSGIMENFETDDWSVVEEKAHEMLCNGNYTEIKNRETGKSVRIDPDTYLDNFEGEFPVKYDELENATATAENTYTDIYSGSIADAEDDKENETPKIIESENIKNLKMRLYDDGSGTILFNNETVARFELMTGEVNYNNEGWDFFGINSADEMMKDAENYMSNQFRTKNIEKAQKPNPSKTRSDVER